MTCCLCHQLNFKGVLHHCPSAVFCSDTFTFLSVVQDMVSVVECLHLLCASRTSVSGTACGITLYFGLRQTLLA